MFREPVIDLLSTTELHSKAPFLKHTFRSFLVFLRKPSLRITARDLSQTLSYTMIRQLGVDREGVCQPQKRPMGKGMSVAKEYL
jgi:hypothetical protein